MHHLFCLGIPSFVPQSPSAASTVGRAKPPNQGLQRLSRVQRMLSCSDRRAELRPFTQPETRHIPFDLRIPAAPSVCRERIFGGMVCGLG